MEGTVFSAPIKVEDESDTVVDYLKELNFIGDDVQAEQDSVNPNKANVTINANPTNVQPTVENVNEGTNNTTPTLDLTVPLTVISANYLRVAVITEDETISSVTYDGVPMTLIGQKVNPGVNLKVALFGLINPNVGTHDAIVTMPNPRIITAIVTGWLDVDTASPVDGVSAGALGFDDAPTDSATTSSDNTVMQDVVGTTNNPTTFAQSGLWSIQGAVNTGIRPGASASRRVLSPATVIDTYGISLATGWAILLAGIRGIASPIVGDDHKVKATTADTVPNYLDDKIEMIQGPNMVITKTIINAGANEKIRYTFQSIGSGGGSGGVQNFVDQSPLGTGSTYGILTGLINGINTTFTVSQGSYVPGSLVIQLNGLTLLQGSGDEWVETDPANGIFDFVVPPIAIPVTDIITVEYQVSTTPPVEISDVPFTIGKNHINTAGGNDITSVVSMCYDEVNNSIYTLNEVITNGPNYALELRRYLQDSPSGIWYQSALSSIPTVALGSSGCITVNGSSVYLVFNDGGGNNLRTYALNLTGGVDSAMTLPGTPVYAAGCYHDGTDLWLFTSTTRLTQHNIGGNSNTDYTAVGFTTSEIQAMLVDFGSNSVATIDFQSGVTIKTLTLGGGNVTQSATYNLNWSPETRGVSPSPNIPTIYSAQSSEISTIMSYPIGYYDQEPSSLLSNSNQTAQFLTFNQA